jgi:hypothetical protein
LLEGSLLPELAEHERLMLLDLWSLIEGLSEFLQCMASLKGLQPTARSEVG